MLTIFYRFIIVVTIFLSVGCDSASPVLKDAAGHVHKLSAYRGKWVIINYWATWCDPCLHEISQLNNFSQRYVDKAVVFGVNYDHLTVAELRKAQRQFKFIYSLLQNDPGPQLHVGDISVVPTTIVINPQGYVVKHLYGPQTVDSLRRAIQ